MKPTPAISSHHRAPTDLSIQGDSQLPAIDTDVLWSRCRGNVPFAFALLGELESTGMGHVEAIARHVAAADSAEAADAAHALKGAAGIIGAEPLRLLAGEIEGCGKSQDLARISSLVEDLQQEMQRCLAYIGVLRQRCQQEPA